MKITAQYFDTNQLNPHGRAYPWCGIGKAGQIVLFHERNAGVMLRAPLWDSHSAANKPIGHYADCWQEEHFTAWTGKIELLFTGA